MNDYKIYKSDLIINNQNWILRDLGLAYKNFKHHFPHQDSTWGYRYYNIFSATSPSPIMYDLYAELKTYIRDFVGDDRKLWIQSWMNFHQANDVLDWHGHAWKYHGYISVDPKNTKTVFEGYEIKNELGNIYIGPGMRMHKVEVLEPYADYRITLGFDVTDEIDYPWDQFSLLPLL